MAENSIRECGCFGVKIDRNSESITPILNVASIVEETLQTLDPRWTSGVSFFLESLRLTVFLPSFPAAAYPDTRVSDSTAKKATQLMEIEANYPKTGINILRKKDTDFYWMKLASVTLQNRGRETQIPLIIPYLTVNNLKILSRNDNLAIETIGYGDGIVGYGPLTQHRPSDYLQIEGEWRLDIDVAYRGRRPNAKNQYGQFVGEAATQILLANTSRAYFEFQNVGNETLYYGFAPDFLFFKLEPGQLYHPGNPEGYVPSDGIWAKTQGGTVEVSIVEWTYI